MFLTFTMTESEDIEARIRAAATLATGRHGQEAVGGALRNAVVTHLEGLGPNKRFPDATTGFYKQAAESTTAPEIDGEVVSVSITQEGMRQRLLGGHITQNTPGKTYLTIPNEGFAYGRLAPEFDGLKFSFVRNEEGYLAPALVATDLLVLSGAKRRKKGTRPILTVGDVLYWLVISVYQQPDPTVIPTDEEIEQACVEALNELISSWLNDPSAGLELSS
jgi:hypothetical protein